MALKRINKELSDLGRVCVPLLLRYSLSLFPRPPNFGCLNLHSFCMGTYWLFTQDPPSSCSAGPIGDDLVRFIWTFLFWFLTLYLVSLASNNYGTGMFPLSRDWFLGSGYKIFFLSIWALMLLDWQPLRRRCFLPRHSLPYRLSLQASKSMFLCSGNISTNMFR